MERVIYRISLDAHKAGIQRTLQGFDISDRKSRSALIGIVEGSSTYEIPSNGVTALMYVSIAGSDSVDIQPCEIVGNNILFDFSNVSVEGISTFQLKLIESSMDGAKRVLMSPQFSVVAIDGGMTDDEAEASEMFSALENAIAKAQAAYEGRFIGIEIEDGIFRVHYADGTTYENDAIKLEFERLQALIETSVGEALYEYERRMAMLTNTYNVFCTRIEAYAAEQVGSAVSAVDGKIQEISNSYAETVSNLETYVTEQMMSVGEAITNAIGEMDAKKTEVDEALTDIETYNEETRRIALGRSAGYVFDTKQQMDYWLEDINNYSKLHLGDNLYIRDTGVPDYWWDGGSVYPLETQKVDLTEYAREDDVARVYAKKTDLPVVPDTSDFMTKTDYAWQVLGNTSQRHTHDNMAALASISYADINRWNAGGGGNVPQDVINNSHTHSNKALLDGITAQRMAGWDAGGGEGGAVDPLAGKTLLFMGDSICQGVQKNTQPYAYWIQQRHPTANVINMGFGGMTIADQDGTDNTAVKYINNGTYDSAIAQADFIVMQGGINDVPKVRLGVVRPDFNAPLNLKTSCGALEYQFRHVIANKKPTARMYFMSTYNCKNYDQNKQPAWWEAFGEICAKYGVMFIDVFHLCPVPYLTDKAYATQLHPTNELCRDYIAPIVDDALMYGVNNVSVSKRYYKPVFYYIYFQSGKDSFSQGEEFSTSGWRVNGVKTSGEYVTITGHAKYGDLLSFDSREVNTDVPGVYPVYLFLEDDGRTVIGIKEVTVTGTPTEKVLESISATKSKVAYTVGENVDLSDVVVTAYYNDATSENVTASAIISKENVDETNPGTYWIDISYGGKTAQVSVTFVASSEPEPSEWDEFPVTAWSRVEIPLEETALIRPGKTFTVDFDVKAASEWGEGSQVLLMGVIDPLLPALSSTPIHYSGTLNATVTGNVDVLTIAVNGKLSSANTLYLKNVVVVEVKEEPEVPDVPDEGGWTEYSVSSWGRPDIEFSPAVNYYNNQTVSIEFDYKTGKNWSAGAYPQMSGNFPALPATVANVEAHYSGTVTTNANGVDKTTFTFVCAGKAPSSGDTFYIKNIQVTNLSQ